MKRRALFQSVIAGTAATAWLAGHGMTREEADSFRIIDSNVSLFRWPFRRLPLDETDLLVERLRSLGIGFAFAGSYEALLHRDIGSVNRRLAAACRDHPELIPVGCMDPLAPGWERDLRECEEEHDMAVVRLHPNYHGYTLDDGRFAGFLERVAERDLLVQIAVAMEDERTQHPLLQVSEVDLSPLPDLLKNVPELRIQVLNLRSHASMGAPLQECGNLFFDTARADSADGVRSLIEAVGPERVLYGSHAPFLLPEASLIRVHESDLSLERLLPLLRNNALAAAKLTVS